MVLFVFQLKCHQYWPIDEGHTVVYGNIRVHMRSKNHSEAWIERIMHVQHSEVRQIFMERFSCDLEMKTREQNRNNKRAGMEQFDWFIERIQTRVAFRWLSERAGEKTSCPKNFLEINRFFALTSYCNTIGQSNTAISILGFSLAGKRRGLVLVLSFVG